MNRRGFFVDGGGDSPPPSKSMESGSADSAVDLAMSEEIEQLEGEIEIGILV